MSQPSSGLRNRKLKPTTGSRNSAAQPKITAAPEASPTSGLPKETPSKNSSTKSSPAKTPRAKDATAQGATLAFDFDNAVAASAGIVRAPGEGKPRKAAGKKAEAASPAVVVKSSVPTSGNGSSKAAGKTAGKAASPDTPAKSSGPKARGSKSSATIATATKDEAKKSTAKKGTGAKSATKSAAATPRLRQRTPASQRGLDALPEAKTKTPGTAAVRGKKARVPVDLSAQYGERLSSRVARGELAPDEAPKESRKRLSREAKEERRQAMAPDLGLLQRLQRVNSLVPAPIAPKPKGRGWTFECGHCGTASKLEGEAGLCPVCGAIALKGS